MKSHHSFGLSVTAHLLFLGAIVTLFAMPKEEVEEEVVLELSMSTPNTPTKELLKPTPMDTAAAPKVTQSKPSNPINTPLPIQSDAKVVEPIVEAIKSQPQNVVQNIPEPQKSQLVEIKKSELIAVTTPPPAPKPSIEEEYLDNHLSAIRDILIKYRKYPNSAVRLKQEGSVRITFRLTQNGSVEDIRIISGSGFEILDDDAIVLIEKTALYFPKPPKAVRITVPLKYSLKTA